MDNTMDVILIEIKNQIDWLKHAKTRVTAPDSIMMGFDQSIKALSEILAKAEQESNSSDLAVKRKTLPWKLPTKTVEVKDGESLGQALTREGLDKPFAGTIIIGQKTTQE